MSSTRSTGIVFYLFGRIFLGIAGCAIFVPAAYLPTYEGRIVSIIETQAMTFASTLIGVKQEAIYHEDYFSIIEYTQSVLKNTPDIEQVLIQKHSEQGLIIDARQWSQADSALHDEDGLVRSPRSIHHIKGEQSHFILQMPIVISNYDWGRMEIRLSDVTYKKILADYYMTYGVFVLAILLGVLGLMYASSRPIVRQLNNLRDSANQVASGALRTRVKDGGIGELRSLSSSFNEMARALEDKTAHIEQLANVVEETNEGFIIFDESDTTVFTNKTFEDLIQTVQQPGQVAPGTLKQTLKLFEYNKSLHELAAHQDFTSVRCDAVLKRSNPQKHVELRLQKIQRQDGTHQLVLSTSDITHRKDLESKLNDLAYYDKLSGLPNRRFFTAALSRALSNNETFVVLFMDLDNFKVVNDSLGHDAGDTVINTIGQRLRGCLRENDILARIGGDEFTAILANAPTANQTTEICERIIDEIASPLHYEARELHISVSIGAVRVPEDANTLSDVLKFADAAMYDAKQAGKKGYSFFSSDMLKRMVDVLNTEEALRKALQNNELAIYYQPIVEPDGSVVFAEALLRWPGLDVPPAEFIAVAERSDLVTELDLWVLRKVLNQLAAWSKQGMALPLSVNISPRTLQKPDAAEILLDAISESEVDPTLVQLEVTESLLLDTESAALQHLQSLRRAGVKIALDDFGTGYSSLSYLNSVRIDTLKLDRTFVAECHAKKGAAIVADAIINMSNRLGLLTVAEGVEQEAQLEWLTQAGCTAMQGFYFGKAEPAAKFASIWLSKNHLSSSSLG